MAVLFGKKASDKKVVEAVPTKESIPTSIRIEEDQASKLKVGDKLNVMLSGTIKSMRSASMNDEPNKMVEVELSNPEISSVAMNPADYEMKRMIS